MSISHLARRALLIFAVASLSTSTVAAADDGTIAAASADDAASAHSRDVALVAEQFGWSVRATSRHLDAQRAFGALIAEVSSEHPDAFAGAEFARRPGGTSRIMTKGPASSEVRDLVMKSGQRVDVIEGKRYSEQELQRRSIDLVRALAERGYSQVGAAVLPSGEIQVAVNGDVAAAHELPAEMLDGVVISRSPDRMIRNEDIEGGVLVYDSTGGSCTSGFSVRSISTGTTGVSTAAHCSGIDKYSLPGLDDPTLSHRGDHLGLLGDVEWKSTTDDVPVARYWASPTDNRSVTGVGAAASYAKNMTTCVHSRVLATRSCDQIYSTFVTGLSGLVLVSSLMATDDDNTRKGDSGGPWSFGTIADGGHRGDQWIWFKTRNVFSKADLFPSALGVEVMT